MKSLRVASFAFALCFIFCNTTFGANYTWIGGMTGKWGVVASWSPSAVPGTGDNVTISSTNAVVTFLDSTAITIASLTLQNGAKIDFGANNITLTATGNFTVSATGGKIAGTSGRVIIASSVSEALVSLTNAVIDVPVSITLSNNGSVTFASGSIFNNTVSSYSTSLSVTGSNFLLGATLSGSIVTDLKQNFFGTAGQPEAHPTIITDHGGSSSTTRIWYGGNRIYGPGTIIKNGAGILCMANSRGDTIHGNAAITNTSNSSGITHVAYNSVGFPSIFKQGIELNNLGSSVLQFARTSSTSPLATIPLLAEVYGNIIVNSASTSANIEKAILIGSQGSVYQHNGTISVGSKGFSNGYLYLSRIKQLFSLGNQPLANTIILTGGSRLGLYKCDFPGGGNFTAQMIFELKQNIFGVSAGPNLNPDSVVNSTTITDNGAGSFYFNPIINNNTTERVWYGGNIFHGRADFIHSGSGTLYMAASRGDTIYGTTKVTNTNTCNGVTHIAYNSVGYPSIFKHSIELINNGTSSVLNLAKMTGSSLAVPPVLAEIYGNILVNSGGSSPNYLKGLSIGNLGAINQHEGVILIGETGFINGYLHLSNINQKFQLENATIEPRANVITLTGQACLGLYKCEFPGGGNFTAPFIFDLKQNVLGDSIYKKFTTFTDNGTGTYMYPGINNYQTSRIWYGGNTFHGRSNFTCSGYGSLTMANSFGDVFRDTVIITNSSISTCLIYVAYNSVGFPSIFKQGLELINNGAWSAIYMAKMPNTANPVTPPLLAEVYGNIKVNSGGSATSYVKGISIGSKGAIKQINGTILQGNTGFIHGYLHLSNISQKFQLGNTPIEPIANSLTLSGQACLGLARCDFPGGGNFTAPFIFDLRQNIFSDSIYKKPITFTDNGNGTYFYPGVDNYQSNRTWVGDNKFYGSATINYSGYGTLFMANNLGDNFYDNANYRLSSNAGIAYFANKGNTSFYKNLTFTSPKTSNVLSGQSDFGQGQSAGEYINFTGTVDQLITVSGVFNKSLNFRNLQLNKQSGKVLPGYPLAVNSVLNLIKGNIVTSSTNSLSISSTASATGGSSISYIEGPLIKTGITPFTYHIGKAGNYAPVSITFPATSSSIQAEYFPQPSSLAANFTTPIVSISEFEYWTLTDKLGNAPAVTPSLYWNDEQTLTYIPSVDVAVIAYNKISQNSWLKTSAIATGSDVSGSILGSQSISLTSNGVAYLTYGFNTIINKGRVTNNHDTGPGSLRNAIIWANSNPDVSTIDFRIRSYKSKKITVLSELDAITSPVILDGTTQHGYDKNIPSTIVEINDGSGTGKGILLKENSQGSEIKGLKVSNFYDYGVLIKVKDTKLEDVDMH